MYEVDFSRLLSIILSTPCQANLYIHSASSIRTRLITLLIKVRQGVTTEEDPSCKMVLTEIIHFRAESLPDALSPSTSVDDTVQKAVKALRGVNTPQHFVLGTKVQDKSAVQITSEWDGVQDYANLKVLL